MREQHGRESLCRNIGWLCAALCTVFWVVDQANAQFYSSVGGVGRSFDPGHVQSPRGLRGIGGFQRVGENTALLRSRSSQRPMPAIGIGTMEGITGVRPGSRHREFGDSARDAGNMSLRSEASARLGSLLSTREDSMRTYASLADGLDRTRSGAWENRGLSIIGQKFAGQDVSFSPTSGMVRENQPRSPFVGRTDAWGRRSVLGNSLGTLQNGLGPPPIAARSSWSSSSFAPLNQGVYRAAEVAVRRDRGLPAEKPLLPVENLSLGEIISARLQRRLDTYVQRGWTQFKGRRYSEAYNSFALADTIRPNASEAKVGLVLSAIATSQYIAASNAVLSMAEHNPDMLKYAVDMRTRYGSEGDFTTHYQAFEDYMRASANRNLGALYAFILWGRGDRTGAQINADKAAEGAPASSSLSRLAVLMREGSSGIPG